MRIFAQHPGPAQMIRHPAGFHVGRQPLEFAEILEIQWVRAADGERHAVHDDRVSLGNLIEHVARSAAGVHEVFRNDLEPVDGWMVLENVRVMNAAQPDTQTEVGMPQTRRSSIRLVHLTPLGKWRPQRRRRRYPGGIMSEKTRHPWRATSLRLLARTSSFLERGQTSCRPFSWPLRNWLVALSQVLSFRGTSHAPLALQVFSPGCSPHPPWPLQVFWPLQSCFSAVAQPPLPAHVVLAFRSTAAAFLLAGVQSATDVGFFQQRLPRIVRRNGVTEHRAASDDATESRGGQPLEISSIHL